VLRLKSNEKYSLKNRGDVYVIQPNGNLYRRELMNLRGREIEIDKKVFKVLSVEKDVLLHDRDERVTKTFGILVGPEIKKEKRKNESHYVIRVSSPLHDGDFINFLDKVPGFEKAAIFCLGNDRRKIKEVFQGLDELLKII